MLEPSLPLLLGTGAAVIAGLVAARVVRRYWPKSGNWGINSTHAACPFCQTPAPGIRKPANRRQFLWGGWTCAHCGHELDKYDQPIGPETPPPRVNSRDQP